MKSILLVLAMTFSLSSTAQNYITAGDTNLSYYYNVLPDNVLQVLSPPGEIVDSIDINNDGHFDLKISLYDGSDGPQGFSYYHIELIPIGQCEIGLKRVDSTFRPYYNNTNVANLYFLGDTIDTSVTFTNSVAYIQRSFSSIGGGLFYLTGALLVQMYLFL